MHPWPPWEVGAPTLHCELAPRDGLLCCLSLRRRASPVLDRDRVSGPMGVSSAPLSCGAVVISSWLVLVCQRDQQKTDRRSRERPGETQTQSEGVCFFQSLSRFLML